MNNPISNQKQFYSKVGYIQQDTLFFFYIDNYGESIKLVFYIYITI